MHHPQYSRSGSAGDVAPAMGVRHRQQDSAGSSPGFTTATGEYESGEYTDSPPDGRSHIDARYTHPPTSRPPYESYGHPPHATDAYDRPTNGYYSGDYYNAQTTGTHTAMYNGGHSTYPSYNAAPYAGPNDGRYESSPAAGGDYEQPRSYPTNMAGNWVPSGYSYETAPRLKTSNSPPSSPQDSRPGYYHSSHNPGPSSPTTPSTGSPSTPFSPHPPYASTGPGAPYSHAPPYASHPHSGTGGHYVPPGGSEYPVGSAAYFSHGHPQQRYSPPDGSRSVHPGAGPPSPNAVGYPAVRPFICEDCGMNFARTHDLKRHQTTHVPGVKKTHPCPYCGKNLSRRDAIKRHVVSKQCPVATEKGYGWPPPEGHVPPLPETMIERNHRRAENPYPQVGAAAPALAFEFDHRSSGYKGR